METRRLDSPPFFIAFKYRNKLISRWLTLRGFFGPNLRLILLVNSAFFGISLIFWTHFIFKSYFFIQEGLQGVKHVYEEDIKLQKITNREQIIQKLIQENKVLQSDVQICKKRNNKQAWKKFETMKNENQSIQEIVGKLRISDQLQSRQKKKIIGKSKNRFIKEKTTPECNSTLNQKFLSYVTSSLRNTPYPGVENYTQYATARLGLSSLSEVKSLNPNFGLVINDVLSFKYPISIPPCKDSINRSVFVAIISAPSNFQKRNVIRKTWKNHLETVHREGFLELAGFGFILGLTENNLTQRAIEEESKAYEDIIQIEMSDFYRNLSLKVAALFNWLYRLCNRVGFVLKVDDDVYINVRNLANFLRSHHQFNHSVFGVGDPAGGWPERDGKWEITFEEWPWNNYPRYFLGATVLMHGSTIVPFLAACQTTPMIPFDDLYIFGMCTERANINLRYSSGSTSVLLGLILWIPTSCELRNLIAWRVNSENIMTFKENMEISHAKVSKFYHNMTHCIISDGYNGIYSIVDPSQAVHFNFI